MTMLRALGLLILIAVAPAYAQSPLLTLGAGPGHVAAAGGGYTGPGNVANVASGVVFYVSCSYAWTATYAAGGNACDLVRASDSTSCTMVFASSGGPDVATTNSCSGGTQTVTQFCNATTCKVSQAYDQTGNSHPFTQGTDASRPTFDPAGAKVMVFAGGQTLANTTIGATNQVFSVSGVAKRTSGTSSSCILCTFNSNNDLLFHGSGFAAIIWNSAFTDVAATENTCHDLAATGNGASSNFTVDGSSNTVSPGTGNLNNNYEIGSGNGGFFLTGTVREVMVWSTDKSGQFGALQTNQSGRGGC